LCFEIIEHFIEFIVSCKFKKLKNYIRKMDEKYVLNWLVVQIFQNIFTLKLWQIMTRIWKIETISIHTSPSSIVVVQLMVVDLQTMMHSMAKGHKHGKVCQMETLVIFRKISIKYTLMYWIHEYYLSQWSTIIIFLT